MPTHNFDWLKSLLLSTHLQMDKDYRYNEYRFLDGQVDMRGNMVAFQSYPRCGNTFLRRFLEQITGVYTGADMTIEQTLHDCMIGLAGQ